MPNVDHDQPTELALQVELFRREPYFFKVTLQVASEGPRPPFDYWALLKQLTDLSSRDVLLAEFRAVDPSRLSAVLCAGIDVAPPDAPIFVGPFDKAWEYGGWPKLMMALDPRRLDRTFREVRADMQPQELERLRQRFPTTLRSEDGEMLWLSRLSASDRRIESPYEAAYGRWIPGDPWEALHAVILFTSVDRTDATNDPDGVLRAMTGTRRLSA